MFNHFIKVYKFITIVLLIFIMFSWGIFAQSNLTWDNIQESMTWSISTEILTGNIILKENNGCVLDKYSLDWDYNIKTWIVSEYQIIDKFKIDKTQILESKFELYKDSELLEIAQWEKYLHSFIYPWKYTLENTILDNDWCKYVITETINVYDSIVLYFWSNVDEVSLWFEKTFEKNNIYFDKVVTDEITLYSNNNELQQLNSKIYVFKNSDILVLNYDNFTKWLDSISKYSQLYDEDLKDKDVILVQPFNNLFRTLLPKYLNLIWVKKVYLVDNEFLLNILTDLSYWKDIENMDKLREFSISLQEVPKSYLFSFFVDYLIYNNFPVSVIWLILSIAVSALIISIFRQIIGFTVFSVYNPLLFALSMMLLWIEVSFVLLFIAFIATLLTRLFTKKIYLLYSAKVSMLIILYFIVTIIFLWLDKYLLLNLIDFKIFDNSLMIFPLFIIIIVSNKVFHENFSLFSWWWWFSFTEFIIVSFCVYLLISLNSFQYLLLSYPSILFFILLANILVWRFTWLQLLEYFRFLPLIKNQFEEE